MSQHPGASQCQKSVAWFDSLGYDDGLSAKNPFIPQLTAVEHFTTQNDPFEALGPQNNYKNQCEKRPETDIPSWSQNPSAPKSQTAVHMHACATIIFGEGTHGQHRVRYALVRAARVRAVEIGRTTAAERFGGNKSRASVASLQLVVA